jgi:hypothetical protein
VLDKSRICLAQFGSVIEHRITCNVALENDRAVTQLYLAESLFSLPVVAPCAWQWDDAGNRHNLSCLVR